MCRLRVARTHQFDHTATLKPCQENWAFVALILQGLGEVLPWEKTGAEWV